MPQKRRSSAVAHDRERPLPFAAAARNAVEDVSQTVEMKPGRQRDGDRAKEQVSAVARAARGEGRHLWREHNIESRAWNPSESEHEQPSTVFGSEDPRDSKVTGWPADHPVRVIQKAGLGFGVDFKASEDNGWDRPQGTRA